MGVGSAGDYGLEAVTARVNVILGILRQIQQTPMPDVRSTGEGSPGDLADMVRDMGGQPAEDLVISEDTEPGVAAASGPMPAAAHPPESGGAEAVMEFLRTVTQLNIPQDLGPPIFEQILQGLNGLQDEAPDHPPILIPRAVTAGSNMLLNRNFTAIQRDVLTSVVKNDRTYGADAYFTVSDTDGVIATQSGTESVLGASIGNNTMTVQAGKGNKKFGKCQIAESGALAAGEGNRLTFQHQMKQATGASIGRIRAAILGWTGAANGTGASDPIAAWSGGGVNPTLAANWAYLNTPIALPDLKSTYQTFDVTTDAALDSTYNNVAVLSWVDTDSLTAGDAITTRMWGLYPGTAPTTFPFQSRQLDLWECLVFYYKSFNRLVVPADGTVSTGKITATADAAGAWSATAYFPLPMIAAASDSNVHIYSTNAGGTAATPWNETDGADAGGVTGKDPADWCVTINGGAHAADANDRISLWLTAEVPL